MSEENVKVVYVYKPREIHIGDVFGELTVVEQAEDYVYKSSGKHIKRWKCKCPNGHIMLALQNNLFSGHTTRCTQCNKSSKFIDITGKKFGYLTVIERGEDYESKSGKEVRWICECDHGNPNTPIELRKRILVRGTDLRSGRIVSCGCYRNSLYGQSNNDKIVARLNAMAQHLPYGVIPQPNSVQGVVFLTDDELKKLKGEE